MLETNTKRNPVIKLTHPEKILYPEDNITKLQLLEYYEGVQELMLPYIINRPLTLVRCPDNYSSCFYQKHMDKHAPEALHKIAIKEKVKTEDYLYIANSKGLLALPQLGVLEIHPWGSQIKKIDYPDTLIFDLDPGEDVAWKKVVAAAQEIKQHLTELHLQSFVKTTGGKGLHVVVPIKPEFTWEEVKNFSHAFVEYVAQLHPDHYVTTMQKKLRKGKIFLDYLRNQRGATVVAPYSTRARIHAPVSTPIAWDELTANIKDTTFTLKNFNQRLKNLKKDPWLKYSTLKQSLNIDGLLEQD